MDERIFNRLKVMIEKTYYVFGRYNVPATFGLIYHHKPILPIELGQYVRKSDHFLMVDEHYCFINFEFTNQKDAFKASQNLIASLDNHFQDTTTKIALDSFDVNQSPNVVYNRLMQILKEIQKDPYSRIDDENVLNGVI
ncbi:hypothetical protein MNB_SM-3-763 [hydrothermal vent metagenome]|uniref:Uncharacterized protein n=1 Tax=hydrothermal vent metagenome TaxID=652676 RepID=A0A1W1D4D9_9ZZZZ